MTEQSETPQASSTTSEADADNTSPSAAPDDASLAGVNDEQLPEDLQPGEDNPLAQPLDPDDEATKDPEELDLQGGKPAEEWDSEDESGTDD